MVVYKQNLSVIKPYRIGMIISISHFISSSNVRRVRINCQQRSNEFYCLESGMSKHSETVYQRCYSNRFVSTVQIYVLFGKARNPKSFFSVLFCYKKPVIHEKRQIISNCAQMFDILVILIDE